MNTIITKKTKSKKNSKRREVELYAGDAYSLAKRTAQGLNYIRKLINVEEKFIDVQLNTTVANTGFVTYLNPVAQGLNLSDRVGDSLKLQRIRMIGSVSINVAAPITVTRFLIVRDLENSGSTPVLADIFQGTGAGIEPDLMYNYINTRTRFKILVDEIFSLSNVGDDVLSFNWLIPHEGHVRFRGTGATTASAAQGSLFLIGFSNLAALVPTLVCTTRVEYTDD